jgi:predicted Zn finger-like uncharacterized protein
VSSFDSNAFSRSSPSATPVDVPSKCPACHSPSITTSSKSPHTDSYWRCNGCGEVWNAARRHEARRGANTWR